MIWVWLCLCTFCAAVLEAILGNSGVPAPLVAIVTFYFTVLLGWKPVFIPAVVAGTLLDLLLSRAFPTALMLLPGVMALALFWRQHGDCKAVSAQALPGALVGAIVGVGRLVLEAWAAEPWCRGLVFRSLWLLFLFVLVSLALTPALFKGLDRLAKGLDLPLYQKVQEVPEPIEED